MGELVTAIIPTYRRPELLEQAMASVLRQTWRPLEMIVVDDSSGDNTQEVLAAFASRAAAAGVEFRFYEQANAGPGIARNKGMQEAKGEWLAYLDDDDRWYPQKVETQMAMLQTHAEAGVSFTRYRRGDDGDIKPRDSAMRDGWVFESLCRRDTRAYIPTLMLRRALFEAHGGFLPERNFEDTEFMLRLSLETPFVAVHEPLTVVRAVESSTSREGGLEGDLVRDRDKLRILDAFVTRHSAHSRFSADAVLELRALIYDEHIKHLIWLGRVKEAKAAWDEAIAACGQQPMLLRLKGKLGRATVAGWFGRKLKKP